MVTLVAFLSVHGAPKKICLLTRRQAVAGNREKIADIAFYRFNFE